MTPASELEVLTQASNVAVVLSEIMVSGSRMYVDVPVNAIARPERPVAPVAPVLVPFLAPPEESTASPSRCQTPMWLVPQVALAFWAFAAAGLPWYIQILVCAG